ncbi:MAG: hypothetical protein QY312_02395 [Candidatus Dojkabacteria bacterium]|nr:MAG: hypothetical protein QY312_02395 [Candidatus Dojkabacteria bacterium]
MTMYIIIALVVVLYLIAVVLPKFLDKEGKGLHQAVQGLIDEYFLAHTDSDIEKKRLRFHRLTIATDRVMGKVLQHYGIFDKSVKQQLRQALERNVVTYDQFSLLKRFHHMRNEVVHEGLQVYGDNEQLVYNALHIVKQLLGR